MGLRYRAAMRRAIEELDAEHGPEWASDEAKAAGKEPIGCRICFPGDGSWPCVSRMVADDLRAAIEGAPAARSTEPLSTHPCEVEDHAAPNMHGECPLCGEPVKPSPAGQPAPAARQEDRS